MPKTTTTAPATPEDDQPAPASAIVPLPPQGSRLPTVPDLPSLAEIERHLISATPEQREAVLWLRRESDVRGLTTFAAIGALLNRDAATISKVMRGKYESSLQPLAEQIRSLRLKQEEIADEGEVFLPGLSVVEDIVNFCELVRATRQIGMIIGKNQTGKTGAQRYYQATHEDTTYCKLPAGGGTNKSMIALASAAEVPWRKSDVELWCRLRERFAPSSLIIIDEFHQAVHAGRRIQTVTVDRIRELHDDCGCGIVLCGTEHMGDAFKSEKHAEFLAQIGNRGRLRLYIPTAPTEKDFRLLCAAYKLPEPQGEARREARRLAKENGIGALSDLFQIARRLAKNKNHALSWEYFMIAHATVTSYGDDKRARKEQL